MPGETKPPHKKPHGRLANGYFRAYTIFTMSTTHEAAKKWVEEIAQLCQPDSIYWCNGSQEENDELIIDGKRVENDYTFVADDEEMKVDRKSTRLNSSH